MTNSDLSSLFEMDIYRKNDWLGNKNTLHLNQSNL